MSLGNTANIEFRRPTSAVSFEENLSDSPVDSTASLSQESGDMHRLAVGILTYCGRRLVSENGDRQWVSNVVSLPQDDQDIHYALMAERRPFSVSEIAKQTIMVAVVGNPERPIAFIHPDTETEAASMVLVGTEVDRPKQLAGISQLIESIASASTPRLFRSKAAKRLGFAARSRAVWA